MGGEGWPWGGLSQLDQTEESREALRLGGFVLAVCIARAHPEVQGLMLLKWSPGTFCWIGTK